MTDISESGLEAAIKAHNTRQDPTLYGMTVQDYGLQQHAREVVQMTAAIQAYLPFHPPASREEGLTVKALEWCDPFMDADLRGGLYTEAQSLLGTYKVWGDGSWSLGMHFVTGHGDLDHGKSAAQEHYTNAVLSEIETLIPTKPEAKEPTAPEPPTGEEELAWEAYVAKFDDSSYGKPTSTDFWPWLKHRRALLSQEKANG